MRGKLETFMLQNRNCHICGG